MKNSQQKIIRLIFSVMCLALLVKAAQQEVPNERAKEHSSEPRCRYSLCSALTALGVITAWAGPRWGFQQAVDEICAVQHDPVLARQAPRSVEEVCADTLRVVPTTQYQQELCEDNPVDTLWQEGLKVQYLPSPDRNSNDVVVRFAYLGDKNINKEQRWSEDSERMAKWAQLFASSAEQLRKGFCLPANEDSSWYMTSYGTMIRRNTGWHHDRNIHMGNHVAYLSLFYGDETPAVTEFSTDKGLDTGFDDPSEPETGKPTGNCSSKKVRRCKDAILVDNHAVVHRSPPSMNEKRNPLFKISLHTDNKFIDSFHHQFAAEVTLDKETLEIKEYSQRRDGKWITVIDLARGPHQTANTCWD